MEELVSGLQGPPGIPGRGKPGRPGPPGRTGTQGRNLIERTTWRSALAFCLGLWLI